MVTGALPLAVTVRDLVTGVFNAILPNDRLVVLRLRAGV